ncbi:HEPN domain-containing protein [Candidatus Magnetominusculus xianensis]|uniref:Endoribonuclease n=1 Tax=Candidatus Magnetominusculus xianensis TaxID=1748249 RepID=A0ABR5SGM5_9BACT|nr:HEPN domain-containing protein [Candidatus Magnetominusculus xianensis]KWT90161.1 putative endoribonuclease [Candidatus Magnetominusculus xianensis]MBF0403654.1 hypothetical protein [Nitrospirota bacterium]
MVDKESISDILKELDKSFKISLLSPNYIDSVFIAKLGVLEFCGWIEYTMDSIVKSALDGKLQTDKYKKMLSDDIIGKTYGFQYITHFRPMLIKALGIVNMEKIEISLTVQLGTLSGILNTLIKQRNKAAHTFGSNIPKNYDAPSTMIGYLEQICPILEAIDEMITNNDEEYLILGLPLYG